MNDHGDGRGVEEDELLRRWDAAAHSRPIQPADLLEMARGRRAPRRRSGRNFAAAVVVLVALVAGVAGVGAWAQFRAASGPSGQPPVAPSSGTASARPNATGPAGPDLAEHEYILYMHRTSSGGWVLTQRRLLIADGSSWRTCWTSSTGDAWGPYLHAVVAGDSIHIAANSTLWTSTDGCASWTSNALPIQAAALAFPTQTTGYVGAGAEAGGNRPAAIFRTDDGGRHWTATAGTAKTGGSLALAFADADHGWATDASTLWTTADGGNSWTKTALPQPGSVHGKLDVIATPVVLADGSAIVVAKYDATPGMDGARGQRVFYRTTDGGAHWTAAGVVADPGMLEVSVEDATTWVTLDPMQSAALQITTDAGAGWRKVPVRQAWPYSAGPIDFADSLHGWMVVSEPNPPCPQPSGAVVICDFAYAPAQHLVATDDGGVTWVELGPANGPAPTPSASPTVPPSPSATLTPNGPQPGDLPAPVTLSGSSAWMLLASGVSLSNDGGRTWTTTPLPSGVTSAKVAAVATAPGRPLWLAVRSGGGYRLYRKPDGGTAWSSVQLTPSWGSLSWGGTADMVRLTPGPGSLVTVAETMAGGNTSAITSLFVSNDDGKTFIQHPPRNGSDPNAYSYWNSVTFATPKTGLVIAGPSTYPHDFLHTSDGGATWSAAEVTGLPEAPYYTPDTPLLAGSDILVPVSICGPDCGPSTFVLLVSHDGGATLGAAGAAIPIGVNAYPAVAALGSTVWVAAGNAIEESADGGRTWTAVPAGGLPAGVTSMALTGPNSATAVIGESGCRGFKADCWSSRYLVATTDGCRTWTHL
jgi:photosystem II stability/assembly factor-like uncharacterized protein